jgi:hypothetical protein
MRRVAITIILVVGILVGGLFIAPRVVLYLSKVHVAREFAADRGLLNSVPQTVPRVIAQADDYTNTVWMDIDGCAIGFPSDRFTPDTNPKRRNLVLHHSRYRILVRLGVDANTYQQVMQPLGFTNVYAFLLSVFNARERDIMQLRNLDELLRHRVLLTEKAIIAPSGSEDSFIKFTRADLRGFIMGKPGHNKFLFVYVYVPSEQCFIDIGVIREGHMEDSDIVDLIGALKIGPNHALQATATTPSVLTDK